MDHCEFVSVSCSEPECGMSLKKSALEEHLKTECKCRLQKCDYCSSTVKLNLMKVRNQTVEFSKLRRQALVP